MRARRQNPVHEPGDERRLADAVAGTDRHADGRDRGMPVERAAPPLLAEPRQEVDLPAVWAGEMLERAGLAPRIHREDEAQRVVIAAGDKLLQLLFLGPCTLDRKS